ncbi:hypothetical protein [Hydrogenimonas sp.]
MSADLNATLQKLRDISPPVEVPDHSLWMFLSIIVVAAMFVALMGFWLYKKYTRRTLVARRREDPVQIAKDKLKGIDFKDAKSAVYTFDEYLPMLIRGDERKLKRFEDIKRGLNRHKYKKSVPPLAKEDKDAMERLIKEVL